jgi:post-segregation antitoxin (ccd killing protein)
MQSKDRKQIVTSLKVDPDLWKQARKAAIDYDITLGELIAEAISDWIQKHKVQ